MGTHNFVRGNNSNLSKFLTAVGTFMATGMILMCCVSCAQRVVRPEEPVSRISLSEENTERLLNATVAFVEPTETIESGLENLSEVEWQGPYCTGFFVDEIHIISAAHCFQEIMLVEIIPGIVLQVPTRPNPIGNRGWFVNRGGITHEGQVTGNPVPVEVILWDEDNDVVILTVREENWYLYNPVAYVPLAEEVPSIGSEVFHVGHPLGVPWYFVSGIVSGLIQNDRTDPGMVSVIQTNVATSPGCSGGPLVNSRGEVVALANAILAGRNATHSHITIYSSVEVIRRLLASEPPVVSVF